MSIAQSQIFRHGTGHWPGPLRQGPCATGGGERLRSSPGDPAIGWGGFRWGSLDIPPRCRSHPHMLLNRYIYVYYICICKYIYILMYMIYMYIYIIYVICTGSYLTNQHVLVSGTLQCLGFRVEGCRRGRPLGPVGTTFLVGWSSMCHLIIW